MKKNEDPFSFLKEIRILDLADEKASFCTKLFADLGACVIKIEKPGGDPSRRMGPFYENSPHPERSLFFWYNNTNKKSITLDLDQEIGRKIFRQLVKKADIMVETFPPGYLDRIGLGFETLREIHPKLVFVSVTNFGQNGPRKQYKSCDLVASAFGGSMYITGPPSIPLAPFGEQSFYLSSLYAAVAILLALRKRAQTGKGDHFDISLQEAVTSTLDPVMVRYFFEKTVPQRQGSIHWDQSFCILPCKDGHMLMTPFQKWETLVEWMEGEGMAEDLKDEEYGQEEYRRRHFDHIFEVLQKWAKTHTVKELWELGQLMRFPWAPVQSPKQVLDSPQLQARRFFVDLNHPEVGRLIRLPSLPFRNSAVNFWKRAPWVGEDNDQIYRKELGLSDEELARLSATKAI